MVKLILIIGVILAFLSIISNNMVYSIMFLAGYTLICGFILIWIGAEFLGYILIIVYVGAILLIFLFIVMVVDKEEPADENNNFLIYGTVSFLLIINLSIIYTIEDLSIRLSIVTNVLFDLNYLYDSIRCFESLYQDNFSYLIISGFLLLVALTTSILVLNIKKQHNVDTASYYKIWRDINKSITINKKKSSNDDKI